MERESNVSQERSGASILVESLVAQGVEFVFGYPGGAVLPIYDALFGDAGSATSWSGTRPARPMQPRAMPAPPASPAWCWSPPALARPMPSPGLPMH